MNIENLIASSLDKSKEVISILDRKDFRESFENSIRAHYRYI